jgi:hypothetical protein
MMSTVTWIIPPSPAYVPSGGKFPSNTLHTFLFKRYTLSFRNVAHCPL